MDKAEKARRMREWRANCSPEMAEREKERKRLYRLRNPEKHKEWERARDPEKRQASTNAWRAANPEKHRGYSRQWRARNFKREQCHGKVNYRVKRGLWPRPDVFRCTDCEARASVYHHPDYDFPLWIEPLCQPCHHEIHATTPSTELPVKQQQDRTHRSVDDG